MSSGQKALQKEEGSEEKKTWAENYGMPMVSTYVRIELSGRKSTLLSNILSLFLVRSPLRKKSTGEDHFLCSFRKVDKAARTSLRRYTLFMNDVFVPTLWQSFVLMYEYFFLTSVLLFLLLFLLFQVRLEGMPSLSLHGLSGMQTQAGRDVSAIPLQTQISL